MSDSKRAAERAVAEARGEAEEARAAAAAAQARADATAEDADKFRRAIAESARRDAEASRRDVAAAAAAVADATRSSSQLELAETADGTETVRSPVATTTYPTVALNRAEKESEKESEKTSEGGAAAAAAAYRRDASARAFVAKRIFEARAADEERASVVGGAISLQKSAASAYASEADAREAERPAPAPLPPRARAPPVTRSLPQPRKTGTAAPQVRPGTRGFGALPPAPPSGGVASPAGVSPRFPTRRSPAAFGAFAKR